MVYENHGIDARYTGPHEVSPTLSARCGTGGNNVPLVEQPPQAFCISGNIVNRKPYNGGNGLGINKDVAFSLITEDRQTVFSRQRVDSFSEDEVASTESARQHKDATDLVIQSLDDEEKAGILRRPNLIRRLSPLECERLQGFPDGWTNIPGASDSARYKALGNSVAIPCVEFVNVLLLRITKDQGHHIVVVFDGLFCQGLAVGFAVVIAEPAEVLGDTNARDFIQRNPLELREDDFQNVGVHRHSSGAVGAVPHTKGNPHFIDKGIKCVSGGGTRRGFFFLFFEVGFGKHKSSSYRKRLRCN